MAGTQHFSPRDIQFQLAYDRGQCTETSYLKHWTLFYQIFLSASHAIKQYLKNKRLGNTIFVKSNIKLYVKITNGKLSRKVCLATFFLNHVKELELSHNCSKRQVKAWGRFFLQ